ncbi:uncharacterized protein BDZ99DRAFT_531837 [Mytilinidion resinicola]|uniref:Uncharacterized protein n=1 Tax=Mytilinidion resinicola TaxID=574789 RepID=A0A6A6YND9_9PEZI|nr:uncharacterized protein BDZ99DRAFT_531837 [Mytilinidion resinicola]KAF2809485.1 hypothetical protein BDZ99DRAFT_531837 [Mytilinidion resinicola]
MYALDNDTWSLSRNVFVDDWNICRKRVDNVKDLLFDQSRFVVRLIRVHAMMAVTTNWAISGMFFDVLLKFGYQPQIFEESSGFRQALKESDGSFELCYQLMYVEPSGRPTDRDQWSFRQTGVYQKHSMKTRQSKCILLHSNDEPALQKRLEKHAESPEKLALARHPMNVHLVVLSTYIVHWQDYIESMAKSLQDIRKYVLVIDTKRTKVEAKQLQTLRNIEDKIVCRAIRCLQSTGKTVKTLMEISGSWPKADATFAVESTSVYERLRLIDHRLENYVNSAEILAERTRATLGLLTNMLDVQNQADSGRISSRMLLLTRESVDDNATVRVITVCTLIYLPASFTATFFGMNFFEFQSGLAGLHTSPSFWIYVAATIPLTFLTVGAWYIFKVRHDMKRKRKRDEEQAE